MSNTVHGRGAASASSNVCSRSSSEARMASRSHGRAGVAGEQRRSPLHPEDDRAGVMKPGSLRLLQLVDAVVADEEHPAEFVVEDPLPNLLVQYPNRVDEHDRGRTQTEPGAEAVQRRRVDQAPRPQHGAACHHQRGRHRPGQDRGIAPQAPPRPDEIRQRGPYARAHGLDADPEQRQVLVGSRRARQHAREHRDRTARAEQDRTGRGQPLPVAHTEAQHEQAERDDDEGITLGCFDLGDRAVVEDRRQQACSGQCGPEGEQRDGDGGCVPVACHPPGGKSCGPCSDEQCRGDVADQLGNFDPDRRRVANAEHDCVPPDQGHAGDGEGDERSARADGAPGGGPRHCC